MVLYSGGITDMLIMSRVHCSFDKEKGAIISAFIDDASPWDCLEKESELLDLLIDVARAKIGIKDACVFLGSVFPVIGRWESIPYPAIFAVGIKRREAQEIARSFNQDAYIYVSRGKWWGIDVNMGRILERGKGFPIKGLDYVLREYLRLNGMRKNIDDIGHIIEGMARTLEWAVLKGEGKERILHLTKTIEGYERKRDDISKKTDKLEKMMKENLDE